MPQRLSFFCEERGLGEKQQLKILLEIQGDLENGLRNPSNIFSPLYQSFKSLLGAHTNDLKSKSPEHNYGTARHFLRTMMDSYLISMQSFVKSSKNEQKIKNYSKIWVEACLKDGDIEDATLLYKVLNEKYFSEYYYFSKDVQEILENYNPFSKG